ncbi:hypothetical protein J6590_086339 [Homalodisca vitripennis]|nr:hypothetical protein J6590_086339 [Homalodisca vitripennis]
MATGLSAEVLLARAESTSVTQVNSVDVIKAVGTLSVDTPNSPAQLGSGLTTLPSVDSPGSLPFILDGRSLVPVSRLATEGLHFFLQKNYFQIGSLEFNS